MRLLKMHELRKDSESVAKKCNCTVSKDYENRVVVEVQGSKEYAADNADEFVSLFNDLFGEVYKNEYLWDTNESVGEGIISAVTDDYELVLNGADMVSFDDNCLIKKDVKSTVKVFNKMLVDTCKYLGISDDEGDIKNAVEIKKHKGYVKVKICFEDLETLDKFYNTWSEYVYCMKDIKDDMLEYINILMYMFCSDESGNAIIFNNVDGSYYLEGYMVFKSM